jgi:Na+-translocating ferredoxin:NAD+ oxidoreductase subunit C
MLRRLHGGIHFSIPPGSHVPIVSGPGVADECSDRDQARPLDTPDLNLQERLLRSGLVLEIPKTRTVILNATCDEPMISSPHRLLVENTEEVLSGIRVAMTACSANQAWLILDRRNHHLIRRIRRLLSNDRLSIVPVQVRYPMTRHRLLWTLSEKDKRNDPWVLTVHQAVDFHGIGHGLPIIDRVVSVSGNGVPKPANVRVKIGISLNDLIAFCGADPAEISFIVAGNPLIMPQVTGDSPIGPSMTGIVVFHGRHHVHIEKPCISCFRCRSICPAGLNPTKIEIKILRNHLEDTTRDDLRKCLQCGLCGFICPSKRNLFDRLCRARSTFSG